MSSTEAEQILHTVGPLQCQQRTFDRQSAAAGCGQHVRTSGIWNIHHATRERELTQAVKADIAYAVQEAIVETLVAKALRALEATGLAALVVSGGVGANQSLRLRMSTAVAASGGRVFYPRFEFCTDNAAMIAVAGMKRLAAGQHAGLAIAARAQWPLDALEAL